MTIQAAYAELISDMAQKIYGVIALTNGMSSMIDKVEDYKSIDALMLDLQYLTGHLRENLLTMAETLVALPVVTE